MHIKRFFLIAVVLACSFAGFTTHVVAMTDFETESISAKEQAEIWENISFHELNSASSKASFSCFDVAEDGTFLLGFDTEPEKQLFQYDAEGQLQKMYSFRCNGIFYVQWDGKNICLYLVREDLEMKIDSKGECVYLKNIPLTTENNRHWNELKKIKSVQHGTTTYRAQSNKLHLFAFSFSQLIKTDSSGSNIILYDTSTQFSIKAVVIAVVFVLLGILITLVVISNRRHS